jgi:hypothetical protein
MASFTLTMFANQVVFRAFALVGSILLFVLPGHGFAASAPALVVGESGAYLHTRQDDRSERIVRVEKGEELKPLAGAVGGATWYLVKTRTGVIGWVKSSAVTSFDKADTIFTEESQAQQSMWSAANKSGTNYGGTWTLERGAQEGDFSGTWTWRDATGKIVLEGTWSAEKFSTGWSGVWRAFVTGQKSEYTGTWTADLPLGSDKSLAELLAVSIRDAVRGVWATEADSGVWFLRAVQ